MNIMPDKSSFKFAACSCGCSDTTETKQHHHKKVITVGFAGQPNTGKSTIFNRITGLKQHVGNWPGKTVEQKTGLANYKDITYRCVDLPGTYSLSANSLEERIARDFILKEKPDVIVVVVDASQLERTLYMVAETVSLPVPIVVALNMVDVAELKETKIDTKMLEKAIGTTLVPLVASKGKGIPELLKAIYQVSQQKKAFPPKPASGYIFDAKEQDLLSKIKEKIKDSTPEGYPADWIALKLLEEDEEISRIMQEKMPANSWQETEKPVKEAGAGKLIVAGGRYKWIAKIMGPTVTKLGLKGSLQKRSKFDKIATHPIGGYLVAAAIMLLSIVITAVIAFPLAMVVMSYVPVLAELALTLLGEMPSWFSAVIAHGLIPGVGMGLAMFFMVITISLVLGFLEDIGYMARLGYLFDGFMQRIRLHGKAFMPLFMSMGCNVGGIVGSRMMDSWRQRMLLLTMASVIPCAALIPITGFFVILFFDPGTGFLIVLALIAATILHLIITARLFGATVLKGESTGLIMELPPYHRPNWRTIGTFVAGKGKGFLQRALTLIAVASMVIWLLSYFPGGGIEGSYLASFGKIFEPIGSLMGMDWRLLISLMTAAISKEAALAALAVIYGIAPGAGTSITGLMMDVMAGRAGDGAALGLQVLEAVSPASALAFIFAVFFSIPCIAAVGVVYSETRSLKWTFGIASYYTLMSIIAGIIAYNIGLLIFS